MKKKHVLLLFTDQQRRDTIHALGNDEIVTPALDAIEKESMVFDRCYTPSPVCVPARMSMMSGQYCARTGNNNNNCALEYTGEGFYKRFTDAGYNSMCVGKMHYYSDPYAPLGFRARWLARGEADRRFDDYTKWLKKQCTKMFLITTVSVPNVLHTQVSQLPAEAHPTQWIGDRAVEIYRKRNIPK